MSEKKEGLNVTAPKEEKKPSKFEEQNEAILDGIRELIKAVGELTKKIEALPDAENLTRLAKAGRFH